jgi:HPt (histidine-containing phosphotransfer) domain-containing protein
MNDLDSTFPLVDGSVIDDLRAVMGGDFAELVQTWLRDIPVQVSAIHAAGTCGDAQALFRSAHRLKSASGSIGALHLSELARRLELQGRQGDLAAIDALLEQLLYIAEQTRLQFQTFLDS